jgi:hypothetical protein
LITPASTKSEPVVATAWRRPDLRNRREGRLRQQVRFADDVAERRVDYAAQIGRGRQDADRFDAHGTDRSERFYLDDEQAAALLQIDRRTGPVAGGRHVRRRAN